ncbi:MAG TPA: peptidoglycan-binding domain-containing protein [Stellaceae bacterium]|nr:peptidoglycan-binding domain-containing protein [Stellaceae bacterium]
MIKRWLLAVSIVALTAGGAYAQGSYSSPAQTPAAPPAAAPAPATTAAPAVQMPKSGTMTHATTHAAVHASSKVKQAQEALQAAGLYKGKVDGQFGPKTKAAGKAFQKENGLKPTARLDNATMKKLTQAGTSAGGTTSH